MNDSHHHSRASISAILFLGCLLLILSQPLVGCTLRVGSIGASPGTLRPLVGPSPTRTTASAATPIPSTPPSALAPYPTSVGAIELGRLPASARMPQSLAVLGDRLYVVSRLEDRVVIIEDDDVVASIEVGEGPLPIAADPGQGRVYVACEDEASIQVIEGLEVVAIWPLPGTPRALAVAEERLFVGFDTPPGVQILDARTGAEVSSISFTPPGAVLALAVDEDAGRLYAGAFEQTYVVDLTTYTVLESHGFKSYITLAVDGDRGRWYTNDYDSASGLQMLVAVEAASGEVSGRAPLGGDPRQALVHPETGRIYVANSWSHTVSVIDLQRLSVMATIPVGRRPTGMAFDGDGRRLYVANMESDNVVAIDLATHQLVTSIPLALMPSAMEVDPGRGYLYALVPAANALFVVQDGQPVERISLGLEPVDLAINPDNGLIYVVSYVAGTLSVVEPDTWATRTIALSPQPMAVAVAPSLGLVYAGSDVLDIETLRLERHLRIDAFRGSASFPTELTYDSRAERLVAVAFNGVPGSNGGLVLFAVHARDGTPVPAQIGGLTTAAVQIDPAERRLYSIAGRYGSFRLYIDDLDALTHIAERPYAGTPLSLAHVPTTQHVWVGWSPTDSALGAEAGELSIVDSRSLDEVGRLELKGAPTRLAADPLTDRVYVAVGTRGEILIVQDVPMPVSSRIDN